MPPGTQLHKRLECIDSPQFHTTTKFWALLFFCFLVYFFQTEKHWFLGKKVAIFDALGHCFENFRLVFALSCAPRHRLLQLKTTVTEQSWWALPCEQKRWRRCAALQLRLYREAARGHLRPQPASAPEGPRALARTTIVSQRENPLLCSVG